MMRRFFLFLHLLAAAAFAAEPPKEIVFTAYNLQNYLMMERWEAGNKPAPKPEKEIIALMRVIKDIRPDILGVCEMGDPGQFEDFQRRLAEAGLEFNDFEFVESGADPTRHVALLSRFPIVKRQPVTEATYDLNGVPTRVSRGFLDVTVKVNDGYTLRLVGAHLKSKLPVPAGQALIRRNEAHLLRRHVDGILKEDPATNLLVYGDLNDTKNEPPIQEIQGSRGSKGYLTDIRLADEVGDKWTHYWKTADEYARIDYIFVNSAMTREVVTDKCRLYRSPYWRDASDHRPLVATILPVEGK
jgi:endonuclease/exonuclease/phosphatase family metal-dependent hydrolase